MPADFVGNWCLALEHIVPTSDKFPYRRCKANENIDLIMRADGYDTYGASCEVRKITFRAHVAWSVSYYCEGSGQKWDSDDALRDNILQFYSGFAFPSTEHGRLDRCVVERWQQTFVELNRLKAEKLISPAVASAGLTVQAQSLP